VHIAYLFLLQNVSSVVDLQFSNGFKLNLLPWQGKMALLLLELALAVMV
jgi:hypothetical protein